MTYAQGTKITGENKMKEFVGSKTIMVRLPCYSTYWPFKNK
jgi:hypothetical protein